MAKAEPIRGRAAATERILEAAEALFAESPPSEVSTRAIAEMAQVNLALIHRYVGSKDDVLRTVMHRYAQRFSDKFAASADPRSGIVNMLSDDKQKAFLRTLAFLVLTRYPLDRVVTSQGGVHAVVAAVERDKNSGSAAHGLAAMALGMGWVLLEEFLLMTSGAKLTQQQARDEVFAVMRGLLFDKPGKRTQE